MERIRHLKYNVAARKQFSEGKENDERLLKERNRKKVTSDKMAGGTDSKTS